MLLLLPMSLPGKASRNAEWKGEVCVEGSEVGEPSREEVELQEETNVEIAAIGVDNPGSKGGKGARLGYLWEQEAATVCSSSGTCMASGCL